MSRTRLSRKLNKPGFMANLEKEFDQNAKDGEARIGLKPQSWRWRVGEKYLILETTDDARIMSMDKVDSICPVTWQQNLIAAAPKMLAALESAVTAVKYYHEHEGATETLMAVYDAIAAAKGLEG